MIQAKKELAESMVRVSSDGWDEFMANLAKGHIIQAPYCNNPPCESKSYLPKGSMSKQERHLWEPKHFACHLNRSNHFARRLKVNASVQDVKRRLLVSHYLVDHIKGRDPRTVRSRSGFVRF